MKPIMSGKISKNKRKKISINNVYHTNNQQIIDKEVNRRAKYINDQDNYAYQFESLKYVPNQTLLLFFEN